MAPPRGLPGDTDGRGQYAPEHAAVEQKDHDPGGDLAGITGEETTRQQVDEPAETTPLAPRVSESVGASSRTVAPEVRRTIRVARAQLRQPSSSTTMPSTRNGKVLDSR